MVQLRNLDDYSLMPGIETGDIGVKMGLNSTDMGYAVFTNVRIPRTNLLMGNVQVLQDGTFIKGKHQKMAYATMMYTRDRIVHNVGFQLAQAVVIATRYSTVREQGIGFSPTATAEWPIMAYKSQHYRLLSLMAQAYALFFAAAECTTIYNQLTAQLAAGDLSLLPYVHATTAALKAYSTQVASDGAEDARKCCGGLGYSILSGLPSIVGDLAPMPTLEGENHVMYQQTARYFMKAITRIKAGLPVDDGVSYLATTPTSSSSSSASTAHCPASSPSDFLNPETQLQIFRHRATRLAFYAHHLLLTTTTTTTPTQQQPSPPTILYAQAWNTHMLPLIHAARAHIELFVLSAFISSTTPSSPQSSPQSSPSPQSPSPSPSSPPTYPPSLLTLRTLFALTLIENPLSPSSIHFFEDGYVSLEQVYSIRATVGDLLKELGRDVLALGDGWGFSDACLGSAIGCWDGDVYARVMGWTRGLRGGEEEGGGKGGGKGESGGDMGKRGFEKVIGPMLRGRL